MQKMRSAPPQIRRSMDFLFIFNSLLLGAGLAADAFSVSLVNGMNETEMSKKRMCAVAGVYAFFQYLMPVLGWVLMRTAITLFSGLRKAVPWIALALLLFIGVKMLVEAVKERKDGDAEGAEKKRVGAWELAVQGIATSIDALSVGLATAEYGFGEANVSALIIGGVTFGICFAGLAVGKKAGTFLSKYAGIAGGIILIIIGIEIFVKDLFFA